MKCLRLDWKSGFRTVSAVAMRRALLGWWTAGERLPESEEWYFLLLAEPGPRRGQAWTVATGDHPVAALASLAFRSRARTEIANLLPCLESLPEASRVTLRNGFHLPLPRFTWTSKASPLTGVAETHLITTVRVGCPFFIVA